MSGGPKSAHTEASKCERIWKEPRSEDDPAHLGTSFVHTAGQQVIVQWILAQDWRPKSFSRKALNSFHFLSIHQGG